MKWFLKIITFATNVFNAKNFRSKPKSRNKIHTVLQQQRQEILSFCRRLLSESRAQAAIYSKQLCHWQSASGCFSSITSQRQWKPIYYISLFLQQYDKYRKLTLITRQQVYHGRRNWNCSIIRADPKVWRHFAIKRRRPWLLLLFLGKINGCLGASWSHTGFSWIFVSSESFKL